jgi:hypothetical protein
MSELEHAFEISTRKARTKGSAEDAEWQLVLDVIGQKALIVTAWRDDVPVKPSGKRTLDDAIRKHLSGFVFHVLSNDRLPERADFDPEDNSRSDVERRRRLNDFRRLPRWLETLERVRRLVEREDFLSARVDYALLDELHDALGVGPSTSTVRLYVKVC